MVSERTWKTNKYSVEWIKTAQADLEVWNYGIVAQGSENWNHIIKLHMVAIAACDLQQG